MRWLHYFTSGADEALSLAIARVKQGRLLPGEVAHLRALVWGTLQYARITSTPPQIGQYGVPEHGELNGAKYANTGDLIVGTLVAKTLCHLAPTIPMNLSIGTVDGNPVLPWKDAPVPPGPPDFPTEGFIPVVIAVVAIVACAVAAVHLISEGAKVLDSELMRQEETQRLIAHQAVALGTIRQHAAREDKTGKSIPWNDQELEIMKSLRQAQIDHEKRLDKEFPEPFDGGWDLNKLLPDLGDGASSLVPIGGLFVVGLLLK